ncbi:MAG TPA: pyridoxal-phosphate dependent enzyme [Actinophytocola sp.]|uniref:pyridoxal-phosphate dependent enzyme n=1 Tax=Actinophytocola sp. TaxID=1872138 RepID=UPI002DB96A61|nr:pyridoxal-phosphate dependent enzyme [Actinophytocola sp.]HEU5470960.1 pyridoxal-phosphate dependent enzyme [Actinophytocola sp.]
MIDTVDPLAPPDDPLQLPFVAVPPERALDFDQVHRRHPALAEFRATLGGTTLREVPSVPGGARILAKCEWENPVGSIKDRTAYALVADALRAHGDRPPDELRLVAYSGGDLAAAMSLLVNRTGIVARFVLGSFSPRSLLDLLDARGCPVDLVPKEHGFLRTIRTAQRIAAAEPDWTLVFQHVNPVNVAMHEHTTGREILAALGDRRPDLWLASIGSGGTLIGVLRALRARFPDVEAVGVTPAESPYGNPGRPSGQQTYEGSGGHGYGIRQPFVKAYDQVISAQRQVGYPRAFQAMGEFFDRTGIRIGSSAAANWLVAKDYAARMSPGSLIVTVFPCTGSPEQWAELGR